MIPQFLGGSEKRGGWQKLPLFKRDTLPPTTWLGTATHFHLWCDIWQMWIVSLKLLKTTSSVLKMDFEIKRQLVCVTKVWLYVSTWPCLFTTKPREFKLILICEISQIFVWRNKAFIFFKRVTSYFSRKPGSIEIDSHWWWKFRCWISVHIIIYWIIWRIDLEQGKRIHVSILLTQTNLTTNQKRRSQRESTTVGLIIISFLIPVIALSGVNPRPVMIPAEQDSGALDGPWFHHWQTLTQSGLMLSVRAPDNSPIFGWEWKTGWVTKIALI